MADLSKIKVGDKLKLEVEVARDLGGAVVDVRVPGASDVWYITPSMAEAAEHIPAPKTFKRGWDDPSALEHTEAPE